METKAQICICLLYIFPCFVTYAQQYQGHLRSQPTNLLALNPSMPTSGWEEWSVWTDCSRTCGGGVKVRRRNCRQSRNEYLDSRETQWQCNGSNKIYESCNLIPCPDGSLNTRRAQCAKYNSRLFAGNSYIWDPLNSGGPCELSCKARGHRFFVRHTDQVTDGTDCSYTISPALRKSRGGNDTVSESKRVCVEGRCMEIGCDRIIGSQQTIDKCGVCGGDETSCQFEHGLFRTQTLSNDFHVVVSIPAGSTRINITEMADTKSFLALRAARPDGQFYINGDLTVGRPDPANTDYAVAGTSFDYRRPYKIAKGETLMAMGPTNEDLDILLYYQGSNPGIMYQYTIPRLTASSQTEQSSQDFTANDGRHGLLDNHDAENVLNSQIPASGSSRLPPNEALPHYSHSRYLGTNRHQHYPRPGSYRRDGYFGRNRVSGLGNGDADHVNAGGNNRYLSYWPQTSGRSTVIDAEQESTNQQRREAVPVIRSSEVIGETVWRNNGYGPCTKTCAEGIKTTIIRCISVSTNQPIEDQYCGGHTKPKIKRRKCNRQSCPAFYDVGQWSACSKTCGNGRRTRRVVCRQQFAGNFTTAVSHKRCRGLPRPRPQEKCRSRECARWELTGDWSECSVKCGTGTKTRRAVCKAGNGKTLPEAMCSSSRRQSAIKSCDAGSCVTKWYITNWEECSADCDRGVQRRNVYCLNTAENPVGCSSRNEPNATRTCARSSCGTKYEWFAGKWDPCSSRCGNGVQQRKVTCLNVTADGDMSVADLVNGRSRCDVSDKPALQQSCNTQSCGSRWHYTPWSECSVSCGGGSRTRDVKCLDEEGSYSSLCEIQDKPTDAERCNTVRCFSITDPSCDDKLSRCQLVLQARLCSYPYYRTKCCRTCSLFSRRARKFHWKRPASKTRTTRARLDRSVAAERS